jgi:hypothetical protein
MLFIVDPLTGQLVHMISKEMKMVVEVDAHTYVLHLAPTDQTGLE